ncbi:radical SAM protein [Planktothrix mougeotii LEGE 06226]|uniref:7-carboxy-7-deazaguanine synthase n=1 Tax=Planktothrix mougeotii LEGE 06226 TaxID=1828728 RepID=A0ABR9UGP0_9CYAN|nr:radical SAM protein [Planktothrix mougeotii LEGE 06226]
MLRLEIPVHETFQSTIQGEGYWAGTPVDFIRLAGCPVGCPWCDTGYADGGINLPRQVRSFQDLITELRSPRVVISGGEPFIYAQLPALINTIEATGRRVSIETSGSFWQEISDSVWVTLSPKHHVSPKYPVVPLMWKRASEIKLVIETGTELEFYAEYLELNPQIPVFLQPEWSQRHRTLPLVLDLLKQFPHYRLSVQLHKYLNVP